VLPSGHRVRTPQKLTNTEESVLLDRIIDLIERGFPPAPARRYTRYGQSPP
jgi:hypothetical protein